MVAVARPVALFALGVFGTGVAFVLTATAAGRVGAARAAGTVCHHARRRAPARRHAANEHVAALSIAGCVVCLAGAWIMGAPPAASADLNQ